ncbi:MAG: Alkaline phosphatase [Gemmataceae bacterium]|nr:Alkaline phosphatase [Gemmataceae bacterium]
MFLSQWKKVVLARMTRAAKRAKQTALTCEPLEDRTTPAAHPIIATSVEYGGTPVVTVYDAVTQQQKFTVQAYESTFTGGVRVAVGDVDGDGTEDLITGAGVGGGAVVKEFSGVDGHLIHSFFAGDETNRGGASVAAADFDGDGKADVVVGAIKGGLELIQVLKGTDGTVLREYRPFQAPLEGVTVAAGDYNGDGHPDVVVGAGVGGAPRVTVLDGQTGAVLLNTFAFESTARGGVQVAAGDLNGDGKADVVAAPGPGGGPRVVALEGGTGALLHSFFAYSDSTGRNGVQVSVFDVDGNGLADIVTANGPGQAPALKAFDGETLATLPLAQFSGLPYGSVEVGTPATVPTAFTAATPPATTVGATYSYTFVANGSPAPTYAVTSGTLPAGLTLGANGVLSGTPTAVGSSTFVVTATNSSGSLASLPITLDVVGLAAAHSTVTSPADGGSVVSGSTTTVTFTAKDTVGNPVTGLSAADIAFGLAAGSTGAGTFNTFQDHGGGVYSEVFTATTAGTVTFTAAVGAVTVTDAQSVTITAGSVAAAHSTVTSPADGGTLASGGTTTVTFTAKDAAGNPVTGLTAGGLTFGLAAGSTGSGTFATFTDLGGGVYSEVFTATASGTVTFAVTAGAVTVTDTQSVTVVANPVITSVSPSSGATAGGNTVTITGTSLGGATSVTIGGAVATITGDTPTQITVTAPAGAAGPAVDVVVTTPGGVVTATGAYTYAAAPTVTSISPTSGPTAGGTTVTITGTGFTGATAVTFGGTAATSFTVDSDTQITAATPAGAAGAADVAVTTAGGTATATGAFTYVAAPAIAVVSPSSGPAAGGTTVTITGTGFTGATDVTFGGVSGIGLTVVSDTQITVTTPAGAVGAVDVVVTTPGGSDTATGAFTYV